MRPLGIEGVAEGRWALLDYADVVVHVFLEPVRSFYDLEGLWAEAPVTEVRDTPATGPGKAAADRAEAPKKPRAAAPKKKKG